MSWFNGRMLGIALGKRSAVVVEVRSAGDGVKVERAGEFAFPEGVAWDDPARLGKALGRFLAQEKFSARRAVLGFPASWVVTRELRMPPAAPEAVASMARMQVERIYSTEAEGLAFDCVDGARNESGCAVLLAATTRENLDRAVAMAHAARLSVHAVTADSLALGAFAKSSDAVEEILVLSRGDEAEITLRSKGSFIAVRNAAGDVIGEIERACAEASGRAGAGTRVGITVWDGESLPAETQSRLKSAGYDLRLAPGLQGAEGVEPRFLAATALAMCGLAGRRAPLDFAHSRLAAPKVSRFGRRTWWAAAVIGAVAVGLGALVLSWQRERMEVEEIADRLATMKGDIDAAQKVVDRVAVARAWYDDRPKVLDCMTDLTKSFPTEGTVWVTNVNLKPPTPGVAGMRGALSGKARDEKAVLDTVDRMRKSKALSDVKLVFMREVGRASREVSFALSFDWKAAE